MPRKTPIPPIRVGTKRVTYTPPGPNDASRYDRLVFRCELVALRLDGIPVDSIDPDTNYHRRNVRADLRLPDASMVLDVPYSHQDSPDGSSWCRPYITSVSVR